MGVGGKKTDGIAAPPGVMGGGRTGMMLEQGHYGLALGEIDSNSELALMVLPAYHDPDIRPGLPGLERLASTNNSLKDGLLAWLVLLRDTGFLLGRREPLRRKQRRKGGVSRYV